MNNTEQKQPDNEESFRTLHEAAFALERNFCGKANMLDHRRCSTHDHTHWKARGSQEALWAAAMHLREMRREYRSSRALHAALSGYLQGLEKSCSDAQEEASLPVPKHGIPVVQWKAEGECLVLPGMCTTLTKLLEYYTPGAVDERHKRTEQVSIAQVFGNIDSREFVQVSL